MDFKPDLVPSRFLRPRLLAENSAFDVHGNVGDDGLSGQSEFYLPSEYNGSVWGQLDNVQRIWRQSVDGEEQHL
jgi:hypothetical protein